MQSSVAQKLWMLGTLLVAAGCDSPEGPTGLTDSQQDRNVAAAVAGGAVYQLGDFALYMPPVPDAPRAVIVVLGSRNAKGFVTGESFGVPFPPAEVALQAMGQSLRALADEHRVAILGTSLGDLPNGVVSDQQILNAIAAGAEASGRAELSTAPFLLFGLFGGGPEASGFTARHSQRVAGLLLKVPYSVAALTTETQRQVPTFMVLAELEVLGINAALGEAFAANRSGGALWAMATEPGVPHEAFTPAFRAATLAWMGAVLDRRVAGSSGQLHGVPEQSGWLGDPSSGAVSPWGRYRGDRSSANWFPTRGSAEQWQILIGAAPASAIATETGGARSSTR
jgi:hypothetical protein